MINFRKFAACFSVPTLYGAAVQAQGGSETLDRTQRPIAQPLAAL